MTRTTIAAASASPAAHGEPHPARETALTALCARRGLGRPTRPSIVAISSTDAGRSSGSGRERGHDEPFELRIDVRQQRRGTRQRRAVSWPVAGRALPTSRSYSTSPSAYTSVRSDTAIPGVRCSGAMYAGVPVNEWRSASVLGIAMPKSLMRTNPSLSIRTFAGLRSRCSTPCACAAARPAHNCRPMSTTFSGGSRPTRRSSAARSSPSDELHREEDHALRFADVEHAAHGRVRNLAGEPHLGEDPLARGRTRGFDDLQRDLGFEHEIVRAPDIAHAAAADPLDHPIPAGEHLARREHRDGDPRAALIRLRPHSPRRETRSSDSTSSRRAASSPHASARKASRASSGSSRADEKQVLRPLR